VLRGRWLVSAGERLGIRKGKDGVHKYRQTVWLEPDDFVWVVRESSALRMAPNVFIAEVVKRAKEFCEKGVWRPIQVEERKVVEREELVACPACLKRFKDVESLRKHFEGDRLHVVKWLERELGGRG
jgi:hypothetical protein